MVKIVRFSVLVACVLLSVLAFAQDRKLVLGDTDQNGARRFALIIGNTHYAVGGLVNPEGDARAMAEALHDLGFEATLVLDADRKTMVSSVKSFVAKLQTKGAFGFFYYSGHGAQYEGRNYLVPIGYEVSTPDDLDGECYDVNRLLGALRSAGNGANVVVLDACRDNPFATGKGFGDKGLASMDAPVGTFIAYATAPGKVASDSGLYCECLIQSMKQPGLQVELVFKNARIAMVDKTNGLQVPWDASSLVTNYYLVPGSAPEPAPNVKPSAATIASWVDKGDAYREGKGVEKDYAESFRWYQKAADAGDVFGAFYVGWYYDNGLGVDKNVEQAAIWYRKAAEGGNAPAMNNIGWMYEYGSGVDKDYAQALDWFRKSVKTGSNGYAMDNLGDMYLYGWGVTKDEVQAADWYSQSAKADNATGMDDLGWAYEYGRGVDKDNTKAAYWYGKAANGGNFSGMDHYGYMLENGLGVTKDLAKAKTWFEKAADGGNSGGMNHLGYMYLNGLSVEKDYTQAVHWFRKGADGGSAAAMANMGYMSENGLGTSKDLDDAISWYKKAAAKGDTWAKDQLKRLGVSDSGE